ncbi:MAG TPA: hypothetical protein VI431_12000 [Candidatus Acidoferrum sp.]
MRRPQTNDVALFFGLLLAAGILVYVWTLQPRKEAQNVVSEFFQAVNATDTAKLRDLLTESCYKSWELFYSEQRRNEVERAYAVLLDYGRPAWQALRAKMEASASREYENLHSQVRALGEAAFRRLSSSEKMALADDPNRYEDFLFRSGLDALPREARNAIADVEAFHQRRDREEFVRGRGWAALNEEDRTLAGSPKALGEEDTEDKLALLERLGRTALSPEQRRNMENKLQGVTRVEASSPAVFQQKYGETALRDALRASGLSAAVEVPTTYLTRRGAAFGYFYLSDARGWILRGQQIIYNVQAARRRGDRTYSEQHAFLLTRGDADGTRSRFPWRIAGRADGGAPLL